HAKWQREIIFAYDLPAIAPTHVHGGILRHVPAVVADAADEPIAVRDEHVMFAEVGDVVFDHHETRLPAVQVEAAQHLELVAFDIDRQQIDRHWRFRLLQYVVEDSGRHHDDVIGARSRSHPVAIAG